MTSPQIFFKIIKQDSDTHARLGVINTAHGFVNTPAFMPVGTQATVKTLDVRDLYEINPDIILGNTYHLHLRPSEDIISAVGGIHKFMGWNRAVLTDSGGFQVWSLDFDKSKIKDTHSKIDFSNSLIKTDNDGVIFRSHIDGSSHRFTPEIAIEIQKKIGADIIMAFDECTADDAPESIARKAMERTHLWAKRCVSAFKIRGPHSYFQALFGIIQGGNHKKLREESALYISSLEFDGIAIGGESVGYNMPATVEIISWIRPLIPEFKPRYTMGVGASVLDMLNVVEHGIDMFDCVAPTRMARNGGIFSRDVGSEHKYRLAITNACFKNDLSPVSTWCECRYCKGDNNTPYITRQYLHHLFKCDEILGLRIASYHNLFFIQQFMNELRASIYQDAFCEFKKEWLKNK